MMLPRRAGSWHAADRGGEAVHRGADVHRPGLDAERVDHQLGVLQALRARGAVGHPDADDVLRAERLRGEERDQRAVHPARESDHHLLEPPAALDLVPEELDQPAPGQLGVDLQRGRGASRGGGARGFLAGDFDPFPAPERRPPARSAAPLPRCPASPARAAPPSRRMQRAQQVRQPHLQVGEQRQVGAGPGDLLEVDRRRDQRLLEDRPLDRQLSPGRGDDGAAGKRLSPLESHQLRQGDVDAVLARDVLDDAAPAAQAGRPAGPAFLARHGAARRARARHDDELGAVERREHRREGMPGVLADQDRGPAPRGIERLDATARLDEPLLVEDPVGRQEHLAVDVPDPGVTAAQAGVDRGIVEPVLVDLVEAEGDIERRGLGVAVLAGEIVEELIGGDRQIADAALEEVPGERRLRPHDQIRRLRPAAGLPKERAQSAEVLLIGALVRAQLGDGQAEHAGNLYHLV